VLVDEVINGGLQKNGLEEKRPRRRTAEKKHG
jgi:hypothetical protein